MSSRSFGSTREMSQDHDQSFIIETRGMSKIYSSGNRVVPAISNINLKIAQGESVAIMGQSGSGKSTLLHLLGCLDTPTEGQYFFNQENVSNLTDKDLSLIRATKIGFVFQSFNLVPQLNVYENVELPFQYQDKIPNNRHNRIMQAIDRVGLSHRHTHLPKELSGGEMQRVAVARALAINPLIILADEPTGNLDSVTAKNVMSLFCELNAQGVTFVVITHDEQIGAYCRRMIRMRDGHILSDNGSL